MAITVSVTGDSPEQLQGHLLWLAQRLGAIEVIQEAVTDKVARKVVEEATEMVVEAAKAAVTADKAVKSAKKKADKLVDPASIPVTVDVQAIHEALSDTAEPAATPDVDVEVLRQNLRFAANVLSTKHGSSTVKKILEGFGYAWIKDVPADVIPQVTAKLEAAL